MKNNIEFNNDKVFSGFDRIAEAVEMTLGAAGKNVIFQTNLQPFYIVTNDGKSIVDEAWFEDPYEMMGANVAKEITKITNDQSGDGRSTSISIARTLMHEGKSQASIELTQSLEECLPIVMESIDEQKRAITTDEETIAVATISAENPQMGKMIAEIYKEIGSDGIIELDNSRTGETYYQEKKGLCFPQANLVSEDFATNPEKTKAELDNPFILIADLPINIEYDINHIAEMVKASGKSNLVIICDKIGNGALSYLSLNHKFKTLEFMVIQAPTIMKEFFFEDIAKATGATVMSASNVLTMKNFKMEYLGTCSKIISTKDETRLLGTRDLAEHIKVLQQERQTGIMIERIRRLNTKVAVLYLSANSQSELKYRSKKADDAINATKLALRDGIVAGGGVTLFNASTKLPDTIGGNILKRALQSPIRKIMHNAGCDVAPFSDTGFIDFSTKNYTPDEDDEENGTTGYEYRLSSFTDVGFDAKKGKIANMPLSKIIDAAAVTKNSVKTALSVASTILSAGVTMAREPEKEQMQMPFPMM